MSGLDLAQSIIKAVSKYFDEVAVLITEKESTMIKLWNTEPSITQTWLETSIRLRLVKSGRLWILQFETKDPIYIIKNTEEVLELADRVEESEIYASLPEPGRCAPLKDAYDPKVVDFMNDPGKLVEEVIDASMSHGVDRVAGAITLTKTNTSLVTSRGFQCEEKTTSVEAYARAFKGDFSGHWAHGSTRLSIEKIREVGERAGYYATLTNNKVDVTPGVYDIIISPLVAGNLFNYVASMASALNVMTGFSVFAKYKPGEKIGAESFSLYDKTRDVMLPNTRSFDDEGVETYDKPIIENGVVKNILHNSGTAQKMGVKTSGNAGWIRPLPWNLEINEGALREEELIPEVRSGLFILNNWYTRLQNYYEGYFSTVSRDMVLVINNGEIIGHGGRIRIATSFPKLMKNVAGASRERFDISWWEVRIPTRTPFIMLQDIPVTKPEV
ncbi:MAG: TldD/PmbA family protein [Desulfurococcaceae archaeon]